MTIASSADGVCQVQEQTFGRTMLGLRLENDLLAATILLDKGADIYELIYKPKGMDVLWKAPWGLKEPARSHYSGSNSVGSWLEAYAGGWQEIFPSGGGPAVYKGIELNFHGEASMIHWDYEVVRSGSNFLEVRVSTRLFRSPFRIERVMRVESGKPVLTFREKITNEGGEDMDYMWSHHPAFGAPFISEQCRVDVGARKLLSDDGYTGNANPLKLNTEYAWSMAEGVDMSQVPGQDTPRNTLAYFKDFEDAWFAITNTERGFGVGMVWDKALFPYAWYWQEMYASPGYPWYKGVYVMAIEPASSIPGQGLVNVMDKTQSHRSLKAGESAEFEIRAVFYESSIGVQKIEKDGLVILK
jgi:Domain of unknown function (DUF4432)